MPTLNLSNGSYWVNWIWNNNIVVEEVTMPNIRPTGSLEPSSSPNGFQLQREFLPMEHGEVIIVLTEVRGLENIQQYLLGRPFYGWTDDISRIGNVNIRTVIRRDEIVPAHSGLPCQGCRHMDVRGRGILISREMLDGAYSDYVRRHMQENLRLEDINWDTMADEEEIVAKNPKPIKWRFRGMWTDFEKREEERDINDIFLYSEVAGASIRFRLCNYQGEPIENGHLWTLVMNRERMLVGLQIMNGVSSRVDMSRNGDGGLNVIM